MKSHGTSPEAEARYALAYGMDRADLSPEAQEAYDRLAAGEDLREPQPSLAEQQAAGRTVTDDARKALADGRKVFMCRIPMGYDQLVAVGTSGLPTPSSLVEAIEDIGWDLDQMSWVPRPSSKLRAEGIFLFRRRRTA